MFFSRSVLRQISRRSGTSTTARWNSTAAAPKEAPKAAAAAAAPASNAGGGGGGGGMPLALAALVGAGYVYYDATETTKQLRADVNDLQVSLAGKTNSAFVFLKPHACKGHPGKVEAILEDTLAANGIRITQKGEMLAEEIDAKMYIDNHYGAIASKAVKLQPKELNVPEKGKTQFEQMFGESWDSALAANKVYNAKDGAAKLGLDSEGLNQKWSSLTRGKDLIKFGGGFYCGKVGDIYVMNGFYMSMRAGKYYSCISCVCVCVCVLCVLCVGYLFDHGGKVLLTLAGFGETSDNQVVDSAKSSYNLSFFLFLSFFVPKMPLQNENKHFLRRNSLL